MSRRLGSVRFPSARPLPDAVYRYGRSIETDSIADPEREALDRLAALGHPDDPIPDDAVPLWDPGVSGLLPSWYMPAPAVGAPRLTGWRRVVAWVIVATFLAIVSAGLCSTYGEVVIA